MGDGDGEAGLSVCKKRKTGMDDDDWGSQDERWRKRDTSGVLQMN